jgi:hypothetical protein
MKKPYFIPCVLLAALFFCSPARAEEPDYQQSLLLQQEQEKFEKALEECKAYVRGYNFASHFDAYTSGDDGLDIKMFGTPEEQFQFSKCMDKKGQALEK